MNTDFSCSWSLIRSNNRKQIYNKVNNEQEAAKESDFLPVELLAPTLKDYSTNKSLVDLSRQVLWLTAFSKLLYKHDMKRDIKESRNLIEILKSFKDISKQLTILYSDETLNYKKKLKNKESEIFSINVMPIHFLKIIHFVMQILVLIYFVLKLCFNKQLSNNFEI